MKDTNEIEKQLKRKADAYIEKKANEMYAIHQEISDFVGTSTNFIDTSLITISIKMQNLKIKVITQLMPNMVT